MNIKKILLLLLLSIISFNAYSDDIYCLTDNVSCSSSWQANYDEFANPLYPRSVCGADILVSTHATYEVHSLGKIFPGDASCTTGVIRHKLINLPSSCNTGDTATFALLSSSSNQPLVINNGSIFTTNFNGCVYDYGISDSTGCYYEPSNSDNLYCTYTGQVTLESTATTNAVIPVQTPNESPPVDNCLSNGTKELCENSPTNSGCGSISFEGQSKQEVCFNNESLNCVSYDNNGTNQEICAGGQKNCGLINGEYVCVVPPDGSGVPNINDMGCLKDDQGNDHCITNEEGVKVTTNTSTTDNNDGTSTQTTTTSDNVVGTSDYSTTSIINNSNNQTTSSTTQGQPTQQDVNIDLSPVTDAVNNVGNKVDDINTNLENAFNLPSNLSIDSSNATSQLDTESQGIIDGLGTDQVDSGDFLSNVFAWPSGSCTPYTFSLSDSKYALSLNTTFDPCTKLATFRAIIGWFLYISTAFFIFQLASNRTS